jgi:hypothetical protein
MDSDCRQEQQDCIRIALLMRMPALKRKNR